MQTSLGTRTTGMTKSRDSWPSPTMTGAPEYVLVTDHAFLPFVCTFKKKFRFCSSRAEYTFTVHFQKSSGSAAAGLNTHLQ